MIPFLLNFDHSIFCFINGHHAPVWDAFFWTITWLGNGWVAAPVLLVVTLFAVPRKKYWIFLGFAAAGMILSGITNSRIKDMVHRPRPVSYFAAHPSACSCSPHGSFDVHVVGERLSWRSFPSGHANTAFCAACVLAFFLGGGYWLAFGAAFLVAYSRVYVGAHFPLDTVAGALLAFPFMAAARWGHCFTVRRVWPDDPC